MPSTTKLESSTIAVSPSTQALSYGTTRVNGKSDTQLNESTESSELSDANTTISTFHDGGRPGCEVKLMANKAYNRLPTALNSDNLSSSGELSEEKIKENLCTMHLVVDCSAISHLDSMGVEAVWEVFNDGANVEYLLNMLNFRHNSGSIYKL
uniref:STAS domain-containing protein n=1 Tax=Ditylenchus dipsaci TaxID=166011 RepID=A0A915E5I6_9BILA